MRAQLGRLRRGVIGNLDGVALRSSRLRRALAHSPALRRVFLPFSSAFAREAGVVLSGLADPRDAGSVGAQRLPTEYFWCRRSIHRLEKGLISRPRRSTFARDYAPRVVELLVEHGNHWDQVDPAFVTWAHHVLADYFDSVDCSGTPVLVDARDQFIDWSTGRAPMGPGQQRNAPMSAGSREPARVSYDDLLALARRRRSVRWFLSDPVPRDLLDQAFVLAGLSPSACNRQPFTFYVADQPERAAELGALAMGTAGFSHQFPCCIALVGEQRAFREIRDRHVIFIDGGLASMSLLFAFETLGLSACTINWPDIATRDRRIRQLLDLHPDQQTIMLIAVGYPDPDGGVPHSAKKGLPHLRSYIDD